MFEGGEGRRPGLQVGIGIVLRPPGVDAVDAAVLTVPVVRPECIARPLLEVFAVGIVVADRVVPVRHPDRAVRPDLRRHRGRPGIGGGVEVVFEARGFKAVSPAPDPWCGDEVHGWFADQDTFVPPVLRKTATGVDRVSRRGGMLLFRVVLEVVAGDGCQKLRPVGPGHLLTLAAEGLEVAVWNGEIPARIAVGGGAHQVALLGESQSPGVVAGPLHDFEGGTIREEAEDGLR